MMRIRDAYHHGNLRNALVASAVRLIEAVQLFIDGESETAKWVLRDLVNVTIGFEELAVLVRKPAKSLHRMPSASGNPTMSNLSAIFAALQRSLRLDVRTKVVRVRVAGRAR